MLRERLQADLGEAMQAKDRSTTATIRVLLGILANAEAVASVTEGTPPAGPLGPAGLGRADVERRTLSEADELLLLEQERGELRSTALMLRGLGNEQSAAELEARARVIDRYVLPSS